MLAFLTYTNLSIIYITANKRLFQAPALGGAGFDLDSIAFSDNDRFIRWDYRGPTDSEGDLPVPNIWDIQNGERVWDGNSPIPSHLDKLFHELKDKVRYISNSKNGKITIREDLDDSIRDRNH